MDILDVESGLGRLEHVGTFQQFRLYMPSFDIL